MTLYVDLVTAGHVTAALNFRINSPALVNQLSPSSPREAASRLPSHLRIKRSETDGGGTIVIFSLSRSPAFVSNRFLFVRAIIHVTLRIYHC